MIELEFIEQTLVREAAHAREAHARRGGLNVTTKVDANDVLTEADLAIQARVVAGIREQFPDDCIVAEEEGMNALPENREARCWFIDPIDGTQNFVRGLFPAYGISIAFADDGRAEYGGVALPERDLTFLAERDRGATANGRPIRVSTIDALGEARTEIDFGHRKSRDALLAHCVPVIQQSGQLRCHCAAVVGICSVATGDADAFIHAGLTPWDFAAALLIAEEAGAVATQFDGSAVPLFAQAPSIALSNGRIHGELLAALARP